MLNFQTIFESVPGLYLILSLDFAIVAGSDAYFQATKTKREESVGRHLFEVFPDNPDDPNANSVQNLRMSLERVLEHCQPHTMAVQKYDIRRPESEGGGFEERYWSPINSPVFDQFGEVMYIIHRVEDVTDFVRVQQQRNEQRQLNQTLQSRTEQMEIEIYARAQELQEVNNQLQAANKQLTELDRAKTAFFSNVSHEFRTPLTLMLSPLEELSNTLNERLQPDEREQLQLIQRNGLRLQKLVNTLLDFSRIEAGRVQASYELTDLATYTTELVSVFRSLIEQAGMNLVIDCSPLPEPVYVDRDMWEKIVLNLLSNAFKFTFAGSITVQLQPVDNFVEFSVSDTGVGIPEAELPCLFERFHRVSETRAAKLIPAGARTYEGSGIGLALVQELVKLHGGTIRVISQVDQGTSFTIAIPFGTVHLPQDLIQSARTLQSTALKAESFLSEASRWLPEADEWVSERVDETASTHPPIHSSTHPPKILLADDNADMRDYVKRLLNLRFEVTTAINGAAALAAVQTDRPDLVLTDVMMPEMDGFELLRSLRSDPTTQDIPIILLSARAGEEARIEGLEAGADDYLTKPFSARELTARVEATLKLAQLRREAAQALQQSEDRYRAFVQQSSEGIWCFELEPPISIDRPEDEQIQHFYQHGYLTECNQVVAQMYGVAAPQDLIGARLTDFLVPSDPRNLEYLRAFIRANYRLVDAESYEVDQQGNPKIFLNNLIGIVEAGRLVRAWGTQRDITERKRIEADRKQAEQQLRESEKFLQAINETAPNLLYIFDLNERRNVYLSPQISPMLGIPPTDVQAFDSQILVQLFHLDDLERIEQHHDRMRSAREDDIFTIEYRMKHSSGKWLWLSSRDTIFVQDGQGKPTQILGAAIDITDRKQAEEILREREAQLAAEASALVRLNEASSRLWRKLSLSEGLQEMLVATIELLGADMGNIQLFDADQGILRIAVQQGFQPDFLDFFLEVSTQDDSACGRTLRSGQRTIIEDVETDAPYAPLCSIARAAGYRAVQSTPLKGRDSVPLGMLSTHWRSPHRPSEQDLRRLDLYVRQAADFIESIRAETALRESERKYRSLFESIDQGFCLIELVFDANDKPFDYRFVEINEAFEQQSGLVDVVGKTILELVPNLEPQWAELYGQVAKSGEAIRFEADVASMNRIFDIYAFPNGAPGQNLVAVLFVDITDRKRSEEQQAFLLRLSDALRPLTDPAEIQATAARVLGEHLGVSRALYAEIEPDGDGVVVERDYVTNGVPSFVGRLRLSDFGEALCREIQAGHTLVVPDTLADPALTNEQRAAYEAVAVRAHIGVPLVKDGRRAVVMLAVHDREPRAWTKADIALVEETVERTWDAVTRARAEKSLAASEEKYRSLFNSMDEGYVLCDVIFNENDQPIDILYLDANPVAVRMTGTELVGRRTRELDPNFESQWFETFGRVAKTGIGERHEFYTAPLEVWYNFYVFKVGRANDTKVAAIYTDVTDRKRHEANLAFLAEVSQDLVRLTNIDATMNALGEKIAAHLGLSACVFAELSKTAEIAVVNHGWHRSDVPSLIGTYRMEEFVTPEVLQLCLAGETVVLRDVFDDPMTDDEQYAALNIGAFVTI